MPQYVWVLIMAVVTVVVVILAAYLSRKIDKKKTEPVGTLHIAEDPDDGPYLFLELDTPPENLYSRNTVLLYVDNMLYEAFDKAGVSAEEAADAMMRLANGGRTQ